MMRRLPRSEYRYRSRAKGALRLGYSGGLHWPAESGEASRGPGAVPTAATGCRASQKFLAEILGSRPTMLVAAASFMSADGFVRHGAFAALNAVVDTDLADGTERFIVER